MEATIKYDPIKAPKTFRGRTSVNRKIARQYLRLFSKALENYDKFEKELQRYNRR